MRKRLLDDPLLKVPRTHPWLFAVFCLPAVASTIAGSIIHRFSWFNLFLPGFWCFFVSCFIIHGLTTGIMTDNWGMASRRKTPVRYWLKIGIWSAAYLFCANISRRIRLAGERALAAFTGWIRHSFTGPRSLTRRLMSTLIAGALSLRALGLLRGYEH